MKGKLKGGNPSSETEPKKLKISKWIKIIVSITLIWLTIYFIDYICVTSFFRSPVFSIMIKSNRIQNKNADYVEKKFIGLGYSFYTRGQLENNGKKYVIDYGVVKIFNFKVKDFFRGVN